MESKEETELYVRRGRVGGRWRRWWRLGWRLALGLGVAVGVVLLVWLRAALYHYWVLFPRQEASVMALRQSAGSRAERTSWKEYRGVIHSHSHLSHDSNVPFEEILRVLQETGTDFIAMSDHANEGVADYGVQWRGFHGGKLFIPGFEMREGWMPLGLASGCVLSNRMDHVELSRGIVEGGGLLFFVHIEEPRAWSEEALSGLEIYNTHADLKDEKGGLFSLLPDLLVNQRRYPEQVFRSFFDEPLVNLARWDEMNRERPLTGIGGNDCHQNTGLRLVSVDESHLRLEDTSPEVLKEWELNGFTRLLVRGVFGELEPGRVLLHVQLDPYERMVRHVGTHVLAGGLTEPEIMEALGAGRAFVAFDSLADSRGFMWLAESGEEQVVMGESLGWSEALRLRAYAPNECRFVVMRDGEPVVEVEGRELEWHPERPGNYRVEARLRVAGEWVPWVYSNPIRITDPRLMAGRLIGGLR